MQKKSLLVALFCGALCLTGCIKNEESASVAQVRIAKANELNSIATLNEAKAQAEVIYANAEATIAKAEAALKEAQAALVLAQAETEKVRAELLKTQVALQEVKVEEEKVELQKKLSELEVLLAEAEAAKAKAEAAKQAWVNALNKLLAQAEVDAIKNAQAILEAEEGLEAYVLKLEGQKADSAKYYAGLYFATLKDIEKLQVQELEAKAARVLVNQGAILAREYIHEEIDAANDTIAMNNAFIEALKEKQTMTPEEAQEALAEARETAGEAYAAYLATLEAERDALAVVDEAFDKTADFTLGWSQFSGDVQRAMPRRAFTSKGVTKVVVGEGDAERTVLVRTAGIRVWSEENGLEFIPFWNEEVIDTLVTRYPAADVVAPNHKTLKDIRIVPATINYDNIKDALDKAVENEQAEADRNVARRERGMNRQIAALEEQIAVWEDTLSLHQAYVDAYKDTVAKYEQAYKDALTAAEGKSDDVKDAWDAFQLYMLTKYPTVSRTLFIKRNEADTAFKYALARAKQDTSDLAAVLAANDTVKLKGDVKTAFEAYAKAKGDFNRVIDSLTRGKAKDILPYLTEAIAAWNPDFADAAELKTPEMGGETGPSQSEPIITIYDWTVSDGTNTYHSGASQDTTLSREYAVKVAKAREYQAQIDYWADIITKQQYEAFVQATKDAQTAYTAAVVAEAEAWQTYANTFGAVVEALGNVNLDTILEAYVPKTGYSAYGIPGWGYDVFDVVSFPTDRLVDPTTVDYVVRAGYRDEDGNWDEEFAEDLAKAGTSQKTLLNAVKAVLDARDAIKDAVDEFNYAMAHDFIPAKTRLNNANNALIEALGGTPGKDKIDDFMDTEAEGLYQKYEAALEDMFDVDIEKARQNLMRAYAMYPDQVGALVLRYFGEARPIVIGGRTAPAPFEDFSVLFDPRYSPVDYPAAAELRKQNIGWLISSYMIDPEATYVNYKGEDKSIAELLFGRASRRNNPYRFSLQWKIDNANNQIEVELPEDLAEYTAQQNKNVETFKKEAASIMAVVNSYKSTETGYQNWVEEREDAYDSYNEARIATWAAKDVKEAAEDDYDAVRAVADEGIYLYDPQRELNGIEESRRSRGDRDYIKISIADQIKYLEEDNERLENKVEFLRNVLKDGKNVLAVVNEILDQKIAVISDNIQIMVAISAQYKAIMNAYLGIVDEDVTEEPAVEGEEE